MTHGKLHGKTAIITGAANGCGRAAVELFIREGANVVGADIDEEAGLELARKVASDRFKFIPADVSRRENCHRITADAISRFGSIDILFNQAGAIVVKPLLECSDSDFDNMVNHNARTVFLMIQAVLPEMLKRAKGAIISTSSVSATTATPMEAIYCSMKAAVMQFTRAVAVEYRDKGIRANVISPGFIRTQHGILEMQELRRLGVPASERYICHAGQNL